MSDQEIVRGILDRDVEQTKQYPFWEYYPLFKSVWNKYYTGCISCVEFINTIYVYIMTPGLQSVKSPLESSGFRCISFYGLDVAENYCKQLFHKRLEITDGSELTDRNVGDPSTLDISSYCCPVKVPDDYYKV